MEIDEDFTDDEIDGIIFDVGIYLRVECKTYFELFQTDLDKSETIDFDEFVKLMA